MALALNGGATITFELIDENAVRVRKVFVIPDAVWASFDGLIADLKTIHNAIATALNAVTDCLILNSYMTVSNTDDTSILGPAGSNNGFLASVVCNMETAGKKTTVLIPSPNEDIFVGTVGKNRNVIDINDTALLAFVELFTATDGSVDISDGERLADTNIIDSGKRISRKIKAPTV